MSPGAEADDTLPVTTATRIDVLRGVAIFGILIDNIGSRSGYEMAPPAVVVAAVHLPPAVRAAAMTSGGDHPRSRRSRTPVSPSDLLSF